MSIEEITQFVQQVWALIVAHKWVPLAALIIGLVVRLLKSDTKIPITIPPRARIWTVFVLGVAAGILERITSGTPWKQALLEGVLAAALAIIGHNALIDSLRGGKELVIPGLIVPGAPPSPGKPPSIPPGKPPTMPPGLSVLMLFCFGLFLGGCAKFFTALDLAADKAKCVVANQDLSNEAIFAKCAVQPGDIPRYLELLSESRAATKKAMERASSDRSDAGASDASAEAGK